MQNAESGRQSEKTAEATAKAAKKTAQETKRATFFVVRHWKGCLIVGGIAFIVLLLSAGCPLAPSLAATAAAA